MKRMLDELKKMDYDYRVPADFSKKVMQEIKNIEAQRKIESRKYVITWASTAAVLIIAVVISLKTNIKNEVLFEKNNIMNNTLNESDYNVNNNDALVGNSLDEDKEDSLGNMKNMYLNNSLENSISNDIDMTSNSTSCEIQWLDGSTTSEKAQVKTSRSGDTSIEDIENLLLDKGLVIDEINSEYIVVNSNVDEIKAILSEYGELISITEVNGKVKIQKEV